MFVPVNKSCVIVGGAVPPLRKNPQDDIALSSTEGKANQIVGVHSPAPTNKTLAESGSKGLVFTEVSYWIRSNLEVVKWKREKTSNFCSNLSSGGGQSCTFFYVVYING